MFERDFDEFVELLDGAISLSPSWKPIPPAGKALFFNALEMYSLEQVRSALTAHIRDTKVGMFQPTHGHLIGQIEGRATNDGRPGVEEAWAISLAAMDEAETVVWTEEMGKAFWICKPILDSGDEVGARMAFKESYTRHISESRKNGRAAKWTITPGKNQERYVIVLREAVQVGRLPAPEKNSNQALLLEGPKLEQQSYPEGLKKMKEELAKLESPSEKLAKKRAAELEADRIAVTARKAELAKQAQEIEVSGRHKKGVTA